MRRETIDALRGALNRALTETDASIDVETERLSIAEGIDDLSDEEVRAIVLTLLAVRLEAGTR